MTLRGWFWAKATGEPSVRVVRHSVSRVVTRQVRLAVVATPPASSIGMQRFLCIRVDRFVNLFTVQWH